MRSVASIEVPELMEAIEMRKAVFALALLSVSTGVSFFAQVAATAEAFGVVSAISHSIRTSNR